MKTKITIFVLTILLSLNSIYAKKLKKQTQQKIKKEMSKEDIANWFKEYQKLEKKGKELKKLNNTLDEINDLLKIKNKGKN